MLREYVLNRRSTLMTGVAVAALTCSIRPAAAYEYDFPNGVSVQLVNTLQYSVLERTAPESSYFANQQNNNDGDNNLRAGIVSNRFDLLTKFDISYDNFGFDASADSFYDSVYNQKTRNLDTVTYNPATQPSDKFTTTTQTQAGRDIQLRNLFVYGSRNIAGVPVTLRVAGLSIFSVKAFSLPIMVSPTATPPSIFYAP